MLRRETDAAPDKESSQHRKHERGSCQRPQRPGAGSVKPCELPQGDMSPLVSIANADISSEGKPEPGDPSDDSSESEGRCREPDGHGAGYGQRQHGALPGQEGALGLQAWVERS